MTRIIDSLDDVAAPYDAAFVDLWGCLHDGLRAFPEAVDALRVFRGAGKIVVLVTNAPRPRADVAAQIAALGIPDDAWDVIASSGDAARLAMFTGTVGHAVFHIGEPHDIGFFEPLQILSDPAPITRVPLREAEGIVCTGPEDPHADPALYRPQFLEAKTRGLKLLCANPDIVVDRGDRREWCAGALAALYTEMGGESLYFGKPYPPIYDLARRRLAEISDVPDDRIICIGDGVRTDILGAMGEGLDSLFITGGLARSETKTRRQPDQDALMSFLQSENSSSTYAMSFLR